MTKLFIAHVQGVYRKDTIAVALSEEELIPYILGYFKDNDDYHTVETATVSLEGEKHLHSFSVKSDEVVVFYAPHSRRRYVRHGRRVVYKDVEVFTEFTQEYVLKKR